MNTVKITANPETGLVFTKNAEVSKKDGKQYGYIRVQQDILDFSGAVARVRTLSALKSITEEDYNKAKTFLTDGREMSGKIVVKESLEDLPGYQAKLAGKDGVACTFEGQQIYRATEFTSDMNAVDTLIKHDNVIEGSSVAKVDESQALNAGK